jgi:hypothetical protein
VEKCQLRHKASSKALVRTAKFSGAPYDLLELLPDQSVDRKGSSDRSDGHDLTRAKVNLVKVLNDEVEECANACSTAKVPVREQVEWSRDRRVIAGGRLVFWYR